MAKSKGKDMLKDGLTIGVNGVVNKVTDALTEKNKMLRWLVPLAIYFFGEEFFKKFDAVNGEYLATNALEKAMREFALQSDITLLSKNAKYIQGDDGDDILDQIEANEDYLESEDFLENENETEIEEDTYYE